MVQFTSRDQRMLDWLSVVRVADIEGVRWALGAFQQLGRPVAVRRANRWVSRLIELDLVRRSRPTFRDSSIIWATFQASGKSAPNLLRQTTRHEVAVATISARYLANGYEWARDRRAVKSLDHQADGIATKGTEMELIEVELTPKNWQRYKKILDNHSSRLTDEGVNRVSYFCTADAARMVDREADKWVFRTERPLIVIKVCFDAQGHWLPDDGADPSHLAAQDLEPAERALRSAVSGP
jgi:hypothetical protein